MRYSIILLALTCAFAAPIEDDNVLQQFIEGNHKFSAAVYTELAKTNTGNLVISPFSVETILSLTLEGATGNTATELINGLSLPGTKEGTEEAYKLVLPQIKSNPRSNLTITTANKVYVENDIELEDAFESIAVSVYGSAVENINFGNPFKAADEINNWVEEQTNHKIKNIVSPDSITDDTDLILVNALYLSGQWAVPFNLHPVTKKNFYTTKDTFVTIDTLHNEGYFSYYLNEELDAEFLELPLLGGDVSVVIALPNQIDGLASLEKNIEQVLTPQPLIGQEVYVDLPQFSIESQIEFVQVLYNLGVQTLFTPLASLNGLTKSVEGLFVQSIIQKTFLNVTAEGIEAAAATEIMVGTAIIPSSAPKFIADHPFLYYIQENGIILFSGRFVGP